jgi:hypothetical protein
VSDCFSVRSIGRDIDEAIVGWLSRQRYKPVTYCGRPYTVSDAFSFRIQQRAVPGVNGRGLDLSPRGLGWGS